MTGKTTTRKRGRARRALLASQGSRQSTRAKADQGAANSRVYGGRPSWRATGPSSQGSREPSNRHVQGPCKRPPLCTCPRPTSLSQLWPDRGRPGRLHACLAHGRGDSSFAPGMRGQRHRPNASPVSGRRHLSSADGAALRDFWAWPRITRPGYRRDDQRTPPVLDPVRCQGDGRLFQEQRSPAYGRLRSVADA
jgi:hypothetical protein